MSRRREPQGVDIVMPVVLTVFNTMFWVSIALLGVLAWFNSFILFALLPGPRGRD